MWAKRLSAWAAVVVLCVVSAACTSTAPSEGGVPSTPPPGNTPLEVMAAAGSFENDASVWAEDAPGGGTTTGVIQTDPAVAHDGSKFMSMSTNVSGGSVYLELPMFIPAGSSYVATAWLRSSSSTTHGRLCAQARGAGNPDVELCKRYSVSSGAWTQQQVVIDSPLTHNVFRVVVYPDPNTPTVQVDTVSVTKSLVAGSFENGSPGWVSFPTGVATPRVVYADAARAHDGSKFMSTNTSVATGVAYLEMASPVAAGSSYVGTAWLRGEDESTSGVLCMQTYDGPEEKSCTNYSVGVDGWAQFQVVIDLGGAHNALRLLVYPGTGHPTVEIDTVSVTKSLVAAGSFENGSPQWTQFVPAGGTVNRVVYTEAGRAHDGSKFMSTNANKGGGTAYMEIPMSIAAGSSYVATAWFRGEHASTQGSFCVQTNGVGDADTQQCTRYAVNDGEWTPYQVVIDPKFAHNVFRVMVYPDPNKPTVEIDTVSLNGGPTSRSLVNPQIDDCCFGATLKVGDPKVVHGSGGRYYASGSGCDVFSSTSLVTWHLEARICGDAPGSHPAGMELNPKTGDDVKYGQNVNFWGTEVAQVGSTWVAVTSGNQSVFLRPADYTRGAIFVGTSSSPTGPFAWAESATVADPNATLIDPSVFVDPKTSKKWLVWTRHQDFPTWGKDNEIVTRELNPLNLTAVQADSKPITLLSTTVDPQVREVADSAQGTKIVEGPQLRYQNGRYFLFYAAGDVRYNGLGSRYTLNAASSSKFPVVNTASDRFIKAETALLSGGNGWRNPGHGGVFDDGSGAIWAAVSPFRDPEPACEPPASMWCARTTLLQPLTFHADKNSFTVMDGRTHTDPWSLPSP